MPEDMEVPTEHLHENMEHEAHHSAERWVLLVALSSALLAALAAGSSLLAGHHANEALIEQIQASDQWSYYQAKGVKSAVLESKVELLQAFGKAQDGNDNARLTEYRDQQKDIEEHAREKESSSARHLLTHQTLAKAVTLYQIAIALGAIAALTRKRWLWFGSLVLGAVGTIFFLQGVI